MGCGGRSSVKIATGIGTRPIKTGRDLGGRYRRAVVGNTTQQLRQLRHIGRDPSCLILRQQLRRWVPLTVLTNLFVRN
jgi:hypothetical protein